MGNQKALPPATIRCGPHTYQVVMVPDGVLETAGADGTCTPRRLTIALDAGQPHTELADTLLHELTHALLATVKLDEDDEERIARALGPGLLALIRANPDLIAWLAA